MKNGAFHYIWQALMLNTCVWFLQLSRADINSSFEFIKFQQCVKMKEDPFTPQTFSSKAQRSHQHGFQQTMAPNGDELDAPPAYTPSTATRVSSSPESAAALLSQTSSSSQSSQQSATSPLVANAPSAEHREPYKPSPSMSTCGENPWSKYDNQPGCCFGETGGCCFSTRGGCCFSDTEGCCFSETQACCFSKNKACCFSDHSACCCSGH